MDCDISSGRLRACKNNLGGTAILYMYNYDAVPPPFTVIDSVATAIDPALTEVFEFALEGDLNILSESMVSDRNPGTTVNTQTLTMTLKKIDAPTTAQMNLLAYGFPQAVVKDRNGVFHAVGIDDGIDFTVLSATGGAKADMNGFTLTGLSTTGALSPKLDEATITAFLLLVVPVTP